MSSQTKKQQESKRRTLKALLGSTGAVAGASVLPDKWSKPLISSVVLPAHAALSVQECVPLEFAINEVLNVGPNEPENVGIEMIVNEGGVPVNSPSVEVRINYEHDEANPDPLTADISSELSDLLEGVQFELASEREMEVNDVEINFDYCNEFFSLEDTRGT